MDLFYGLFALFAILMILIFYNGNIYQHFLNSTNINNSINYIKKNIDKLNIINPISGIMDMFVDDDDNDSESTTDTESYDESYDTPTYESSYAPDSFYDDDSVFSLQEVELYDQKDNVDKYRDDFFKFREKTNFATSQHFDAVDKMAIVKDSPTWGLGKDVKEIYDDLVKN